MPSKLGVPGPFPYNRHNKTDNNHPRPLQIGGKRCRLVLQTIGQARGIVGTKKTEKLLRRRDGSRRTATQRRGPATKHHTRNKEHQAPAGRAPRRSGRRRRPRSSRLLPTIRHDQKTANRGMPHIRKPPGGSAKKRGSRLRFNRHHKISFAIQSKNKAAD